MNYYLLLGVPQDADPDTIRSAFRVLARRYHPDAGEGSSPERFREVLAAYETLNDPTRRGYYDRILQSRRAPMAQFVEPLRAQGAAEPILSRRRRAVHATLVHEAFWPTRLEALIDGLFQSWDEMFFGAPRRRDRV
jgi:curved DNA-binding protein CbpA